MAEPPLVLEGEVRRIVEVHVGLRGAVQEQRPRARALTVGDEFGEAAVHRLGDGLLLALGPLAVARAPGRSSTCHARSSSSTGSGPVTWGCPAAGGGSAHPFIMASAAVVGRLDEPGRLVEGGPQDRGVGDRGLRGRMAGASRPR